MLGNYLKVALRTLRRRPGYTAINIGGLAVGLAACLLIALWVQDELSYDRFHEKADRIHRITLRQESAEGADETVRRAVTPPALGPALAREMPMVEETVRLSGGRGEAVVRVGREVFQEEGFAFADSTFFEVFDGFEMLRGASGDALTSPNGVVLTQSAARRYFPDQSPVGQALRVEAGRVELDLVVTGIMKDVPANAHFDFDLLASRAALTEQIGGLADEVWWLFGDYTYALLEEGAGAEALARQLPAFAQHHTDVRRGTRLRFALQPLPSIHLHSHLESEWKPNGRVQYVWTLGLAGLLVLLVAAFNFVNLATARLSERALEAGVRRAVGAQRRQVAARFLVESLLLSLAAGVVALLLARAGRPLVETLLGQPLAGGGLLKMAFATLSAALVVGLLAGAYPALVLSGFRPAAVLRGQISGGSGRRGTLLRKGLVAAQFAVAVALIAGAGVVHQQFSFLLGKDLGLQTERIAVVPAPPNAPNPEAVRQTLGAHSSVEGVTAAGRVPTQIDFTNSTIIPEGSRQAVPIQWNPVGPGFASLLDLRIAEGRDLDPTRAADSAAFLINRTAARRFGWEEPLGKALRSAANDSVMGRVVGVTEDAHFQSLHRTIAPGVFFLGPPRTLRHYLVRLRRGQVREGMAHLEQAWQALAPSQPFDVSFLDKQYGALYESEQHLRTLFAVFAGLAIFLACLGLFGLAAFAAERRRKEIAVRKTFGATTRQLVALLSKDFLKLVAVGFAIATPLAYFAMQRWLEGFAYRIELGPLVFLAAGALALVVALAATGAQALHAARTNPAQALRDE